MTSLLVSIYSWVNRLRLTKVNCEFSTKTTKRFENKSKNSSKRRQTKKNWCVTSYVCSNHVRVTWFDSLKYTNTTVKFFCLPFPKEIEATQRKIECENLTKDLKNSNETCKNLVSTLYTSCVLAAFAVLHQRKLVTLYGNVIILGFCIFLFYFTANWVSGHYGEEHTVERWELRLTTTHRHSSQSMYYSASSAAIPKSEPTKKALDINAVNKNFIPSI